jgi:hypothetical protein
VFGSSNPPQKRFFSDAYAKPLRIARDDNAAQMQDVSAAANQDSSFSERFIMCRIHLLFLDE